MEERNEGCMKRLERKGGRERSWRYKGEKMVKEEAQGGGDEGR